MVWLVGCGGKTVKPTFASYLLKAISIPFVMNILCCSHQYSYSCFLHCNNAYYIMHSTSVCLEIREADVGKNKMASVCLPNQLFWLVSFQLCSIRPGQLSSFQIDYYRVFYLYFNMISSAILL